MTPIYAFAGAERRQPTLSIGRAPGCDLVLEDARVEHQHAEIVHQGGRFVLIDRSRAGVRVDGERIVERAIEDRDVAAVGSFELSFRVDGARLAIDARKTKDRGDVLWVEPEEVKLHWRAGLMLAIGVITTVAAVWLIQAQGTGAFVKRRVSAAHQSPRFAAAVQADLRKEGGCRPCHAPFGGPDEAACAACHERATHGLREAHATVAEMAGGARCTACHTEHAEVEIAPRLIAGERCAACHADRHAAMLAGPAGPVVAPPPDTEERLARRAALGTDLLADVAFTGEARHDALHERHLQVPGKCVACHQGDQDTGRAFAACATCHGPRSREETFGAAATRCSDCHREHGPSQAWASARTAPGRVISPDAKVTGWLFLLVLPLGLFGFQQIVTSRKRTRPAPAPPEEGPLLCDGVTAARARRLPRLIANRCSGNADCVEACPYGVLEIDPATRKPRLARADLCHECGTCVEKCGPGALVLMAPDEPFPLVERPAVDANYETSAGGSEGGVYVIGEATAKPGVKNGINVGYSTIFHILSRGILPGTAARAGVELEVLIVGSGPAGLSAAITAHEQRLRYRVLEQREIFAATVADYPKAKIVHVNPPTPRNPAAPAPGELRKLGSLWFDRDAPREELLATWSRYARLLDIRCGERVEGLAHDRGVFTVKTTRGTHRALRVILAPGSRGDPRKLGKPGEHLPKVKYALDDADRYAGRSCMVVGGGNSAVEAAVALARAGARTSIVYRQKRFTRATPKNREDIAKLIAEGKVTAYLETNPVEVRAGSVVLDRPPGEVPNEVVFCLLGANPPSEWLAKLGIELIEKPADWEPGPSDSPAFALIRSR